MIKFKQDYIDKMKRLSEAVDSNPVDLFIRIEELEKKLAEMTVHRNQWRKWAYTLLDCTDDIDYIPSGEPEKDKLDWEK